MMHATPPRPIAFGQQAFPDAARCEAAVADILQRQYYTNQGPLTRRLEQRLAEASGCRHAVCVTNDTIAVLMAVEALGLQGAVLLPASAGAAVFNGLRWAGLQPWACPLPPGQAAPDAAALDAAAAELAAQGQPLAALWCETGLDEGLTARAWAAARGLPLLTELSATFDGGPLRLDGPLGVLSLHADAFFNSLEGGCILTDDDGLAARLRNIRSSYGAGPPVDVVRTSNGRMSEPQAAIGLLNLDTLAAQRARNAARGQVLARALAGTPGLRLCRPAEGQASNHQALLLWVEEGAFGLSASALRAALAAGEIDCRPAGAQPGALWLPQQAGLRDEDMRHLARCIRAAGAAALSEQEA